MSVDRAPTGICGLDLLIDGGFHRGSLILIAGNPGTGKTIFSAQYIYRGASEYGENGVYASLAESKDAFYKSMLNFGFDFKRLEEKGSFRYLDLVTVREEGITPILKLIIETVNRLKAKRLVIDSFSALVQAFEKPRDARIVLQTILSRIIRHAECTTILVCEIPFGSKRIGASIEEFVADGVIILNKGEHGEGRLIREIAITKLRGTRLIQPKYFFTLEGGFKVFQPFELQKFKRKSKFRPIVDLSSKFSTGSEDLDKILGGGYPKGGIILFEIGENVSSFNWQLLLFPTLANFIAKNRGCIIIPMGGFDVEPIILKMNEMYGFAEEDLNSLLRIFQISKLEKKEDRSCVVTVKGKNILEDYSIWVKVAKTLKENTGQPIIEFVAIDTLEATYGAEAFREIINSEMSRARNEKNLIIGIVGPGLERLTTRAATISDIHLKLIRDHGTLLLYGNKPRTALYAVDIDQTKGYYLPKLTQIT